MKRIIALFLIFYMLYSHVAFASTLTSSTLSIPYSFVDGTAASASEVNANFTAGQTTVNTLVTDTQTLNTDKAELSSSGQTFSINNTFSGTSTFNGNVTLKNWSFASSSGFNDPEFRINADASTPVWSCFTYGGTSSSGLINAGICITPAGVIGAYSSGLSSSGYLPLRASYIILDTGCTATATQACIQSDVVLDTTNQTVAGVKTYSSAIVQSVDASASNELATWGQVQTADSAITAGGASYGTSAPSTPCTQGATYNRSTSGAIVTYICTSGGYSVNNSYHNTSVTFTEPITLSSSGSNISGAANLSGAVTFSGQVAWSSSGFDGNGVLLKDIGDPVDAQDAVTKTYFDTNQKVDAVDVYYDGNPTVEIGQTSVIIHLDTVRKNTNTNIFTDTATNGIIILEAGTYLITYSCTTGNASGINLTLTSSAGAIPVVDNITVGHNSGLSRISNTIVKDCVLNENLYLSITNAASSNDVTDPELVILKLI